MRHSVLIVEDDDDIRETLGELINDEGYTVTTAANGEKGLASLREDHLPDLILVDLMMPRMSGKEFILKAREIEKAKNIPIIVMSALNLSDIKASELDVAGHLKKPLAIDELFSMMNRHCA